MSYPIRCVDLQKKFRRVQALDRLNLEVPEGAIYALIGSNGAGKSTAIKTMMNIHQPDAGSVEIRAKDSRGLRGRDFAGIGYVSENQKIPDWMTVDYFILGMLPGMSPVYKWVTMQMNSQIRDALQSGEEVEFRPESRIAVIEREIDVKDVERRF